MASRCPIDAVRNVGVLKDVIGYNGKPKSSGLVVKLAKELKQSCVYIETRVDALDADITLDPNRDDVAESFKLKCGPY